MKNENRNFLKTIIAIIMILLVFLFILSAGLWIIKKQGTIPKEEKAIQNENIQEQEEKNNEDMGGKRKGFTVKKEDIIQSYKISGFLSDDIMLYQMNTQFKEKPQDISAYDAALKVMDKTEMIFPDFEWEKEIYIYYNQAMNEEFCWNIYIINSKSKGELLRFEAMVDAVTGEILSLYSYKTESEKQSNTEKWLSQKDFLYFSNINRMGALGRELIKKYDLAKGELILKVSPPHFDYDTNRSIGISFVLGNKEFADKILLFIDMNTEELRGYQIIKYSDSFYYNLF